MKPWLRYLLLAIGGAALGVAYQQLVGCATGTCPITASSVNTAVYFALMALLLPSIFAPGRKRE